jgi:hypothetical protein
LPEVFAEHRTRYTDALMGLRAGGDPIAEMPAATT